MKRINWYFMTFVAIAAYSGGSLIADFGEVNPSFTVDHTHLVTMIVMFTAIFILGYLTRRHEE